MITIVLAVIKLAAVTFFGFFFYKQRAISDKTLDLLTFLTVNIAVPALIFSRLIQNAPMVLANSLWLFLGLSAGFFLLGWLIAAAFFRNVPDDARPDYILLASLQNCGYLPMNIAVFLFAPPAREQFLVYTFLYLLGFNIVMWSVGSFFIYKKRDERFELKSLFSLPVISTLVALPFVYTSVYRFVPRPLLSFMQVTGETSFALSLVILGCWLAKAKTQGMRKKMPAFVSLVFSKLVVLPLACLALVWLFKIYSLFGLFIMIQAAMPSASTLPIIAQARKGNSEFVSQGVLVTHLAGLVSVPLWVWLFGRVSGTAL